MHVFQEPKMLPGDRLQAWNGFPWQNKPVVACFRVFVFDDYSLLVFVNLAKQET